MRRINAEILKCEMTLLGMELENRNSWNVQLGRVRDLVNNMEGVDGAWYFEPLKGTLDKVITKILCLDIKKERDWSVFHSLLDECDLAFEILKYIPIIHVKKTFEALYNGLNSEIIKTVEWMKIQNKDEKIMRIMKSLGDAIETIDDQNISLIVGQNGLEKMKLIAGILNGR